MKFLKFLAAVAACVGLIYALSTSLHIKGQNLPAFGNLFNPFSGFWQNAEHAVGINKDQTIQLSGLQGNVKVVYDDRQVPHIFADQTIDAIKTQGYIHAQNRLFQMDIASRSAAGRLSEVIGEKTLEYDKTERRHGMLAAAENAVEGWKKNPEMYALVEAYCEGVNAYIMTLTEKTMPVEYKILGFKPEKWTPLHSALFFKSMCRTLARGEYDAEASNTLQKIGETDFVNLFPERHPDQMPIVPNGTKWGFKAQTTNSTAAPKTSEQNTIIDKPDNGNKEPGIGSNNWVVSGKKTASGHPILCGDPHLNMTLPSIWYEIQISTPEFNTYGVSLPGIPFVIIGFNNDIAWTQTNSQHDVADWYRLEWKDNAKKEYKLDGQYVTVTEKVEDIYVKGKGVIKDVVKYTKFGPIAYEDPASVRNDLAFHWIAAEQNPNDLATFYQLAKAKNFDDYSNALKNYAFPMQNYAFACKNGDIAIRTQGWLPIKPKGFGNFITDGTNSSNTWKGYAPFEHMPYVKNPSSGYAVSANQNTTDASYPYYYSSRNFDNFRARRINKLLSEDKKFSIEDMRKMQYDIYGLEAEECLPTMLQYIDSTQLNPAEKAIVATLKTWDFQYSKDSKAAMYASVWMDKFRKMTWDDMYLREKLNPYLLPSFWRTVTLVKEQPKSKHFDIVNTPAQETAPDVLAVSLKATIEEIAKVMVTKANPNLDYGSYKDVTIEHLAKIPGFAQKVYTGGDGNAINATKVYHGPSWRMVVEMGDTPRAYVVYPGGQSGNPGSPNYDNFTTRWENGEHYEALFLKNADEKNERLKYAVLFQK